jgi:tetratricopeptide (TPR) repeat protein
LFQWLGEQLIGLNVPTTASTGTTFTFSNVNEASEDSDVYLFAKSLFDLKEYERCAHVLVTGQQKSETKKNLFLRYYAMFLVGEQIKERQKLELKSSIAATQTNAKSTSGIVGFDTNNTSDFSNISNSNLSRLHTELSRLINVQKSIDEYLLYLYGVVLKEMKLVQKAIHVLIESVTLNPLLWCSWLEIVQILQGNTPSNIANSGMIQQQNIKANHRSEPAAVSLVDLFNLLNQRQQQMNHSDSNKRSVFIIMRELFKAKIQVEGSFSQTGLQSHSGINDSESASATTSTFEQVSQTLHGLRIHVFPNSLYILCELGVTNYHLQRFDKALELFSFIRKNDPYRYEHMQTYSNIFFIRGMRRELSVLAHELHKTHKYKPETCCVLGNYYSMRGEHERAVIYFRRALQLNPMFLSAWTLMGHEYVEMKNTTAAVSAYRTAVDIQPRDYRAWYGLGQTYEILSMPHYALYYYSKACVLRPYDGRMWSALAGCYEALEQYRDALRCYQRSRENGEQTRALVKMGELYRKMGDNVQAAHFFTKCLALRQNNDRENASMVISEEMEAGMLLFLAKYNMREAKPPDFEQARHYCMLLLQQFPNYSQKEHATQILKELQALSTK